MASLTHASMRSASFMAMMGPMNVSSSCGLPFFRAATAAASFVLTAS